MNKKQGNSNGHYCGYRFFSLVIVGASLFSLLLPQKKQSCHTEYLPFTFGGGNRKDRTMCLEINQSTRKNGLVFSKRSHPCLDQPHAAPV